MSVPVQPAIKPYRSGTRTGDNAHFSTQNEYYRLKLYFLLAAAAAVRLWVMPITSGLWLDETTTYWSAYKGIGAAISRSQFWPGQNVLYSVIAAIAIRLGGHSEVVLRLPSLLAAFGTAWFLFRLGERFFDRETAALSLVVFASLQSMFETAANGRPYSLGLLFVVASTWQLVKWLDSGRTRDMLLYALLAAAVPYFHYLFATIFIVHAIYAVYRVRREARRQFWELALAIVAVVALLSPLVWNATRGKHISTASSFTSTPDFEKLFSSGMPAVLGTGIFLGLLLGYSLQRKLKAENVVAPSPDTLLLLTTWFVVPIVTLFAVSRWSEFKVFVPRYYLPASPALALLVGWGIRNISEKVRVVVSACVVVTAISAFGTHHFWVNPYLEDWRRAAKEVQAANLDPHTPVLVRTGLIETAKPTWDVELDRDSPLLAPLAKYPVPGRILLVPSGLNEPSVRYMNDLSSKLLDSSAEFVYLTRDLGDPFEAWLSGRFSGRGFTVRKLGHADGVSVFLFQRRPS